MGPLIPSYRQILLVKRQQNANFVDEYTYFYKLAHHSRRRVRRRFARHIVGLKLSTYNGQPPNLIVLQMHIIGYTGREVAHQSQH